MKSQWLIAFVLLGTFGLVGLSGCGGAEPLSTTADEVLTDDPMAAGNDPTAGAQAPNP